MPIHAADDSDGNLWHLVSAFPAVHAQSGQQTGIDPGLRDV
jgi:hypothetical protein